MALPVLAKLGRWVSELEHEAVDPPVLDAARYQTLNMVATALAGARSSYGVQLRAALARFGSAAGRCTVWCQTARQAPPPAAWANAAFSMVHDFDDIVWMGHTGHSAVFAALAVAEHERASDRDFLTAVVAANEVAGRLGASCLFGPLNGQMWTFIHLAGAAAATAKLLRLDAERTTHALAIALAQPNFALQPGFLGPSSKLLAAATPTATGVRAGYLAQAGLTGAPGLVEDARGFWPRFSYVPLPGMMEGLGDWWVMDTLTVKTVPACHYFQTAFTAVDRIAQRRGPLEPEQIGDVEVDTTKLGVEASRFAAAHAPVGEVLTPVNVNFDLGVSVAIRLLAGRLTCAELEPDWLASRSSALRRLRERVTVRHAPELTLRTVGAMARVPAGRAALAALRPAQLRHLVQRYRTEYRSELVSAAELGPWLRALARPWWRRPRDEPRERASSSRHVPLYFPNRVTIRFADGRRETERVDLPAGSLCHPGVHHAIEAKFADNVGPALGAERAAEAFRCGLQLGEGRLDELVALLRAVR